MKVFSAALLLLLIVDTKVSYSQSDPEFPNGFTTYLKLHQGMATDFTRAPDLYVAGIQLAPQITVVEHLIRAGITGDVFYLQKKVQASTGPSVSIKIKTFNAGVFGSAGNLHASFDHMWGTGDQRLAGGGLVADIGNLVTFALTAHRDYRLKNWWFLNQLGIRISRKKKTDEPFNQ